MRVRRCFRGEPKLDNNKCMGKRETKYRILPLFRNSLWIVWIEDSSVGKITIVILLVLPKYTEMIRKMFICTNQIDLRHNLHRQGHMGYIRLSLGNKCSSSKILFNCYSLYSSVTPEENVDDSSPALPYLIPLDDFIPTTAGTRDPTTHTHATSWEARW